MTDIRKAKIGDEIEWVRFGHWVTGTVHDVYPGGLILTQNGKTTALTMDKLIECKAYIKVKK